MKDVTIAIDDTWEVDAFHALSPVVEAGDYSIRARYDRGYAGWWNGEARIYIELDGRRCFEVSVENRDNRNAPEEAFAEAVDLANEIGPSLGLRFVTEGGVE